MIEIKLIQEQVTLDKSAKVLIYEDGKLIKSVTAEIKSKRGADGGRYPCVQLNEDVLK